MQEGYAVSDFNFIKKGPADHQRSAGISDRKMSRIVTARKVGMMTAQGVNNKNKSTYGLIKLIALNLTSISGFVQVLMLIAIVLNMFDAFTLGYFLINLLVCIVSLHSVYSVDIE